MTRVAALIITAVVLISCKEMPARYYMCDINKENCELKARFDTLWACERHKVFASAYCDSESVPGEIICDTEKEPDDAVSYCEDKSLSR